MSESEYFAMHREAEQGDDKNKYDQKELERAFADLDRDGSETLSLDEWRRPFEEHTDAWLQVHLGIRPSPTAPTALIRVPAYADMEARERSAPSPRALHFLPHSYAACPLHLVTRGADCRHRGATRGADRALQGGVQPNGLEGRWGPGRAGAPIRNGLVASPPTSVRLRRRRCWP